MSVCTSPAGCEPPAGLSNERPSKQLKPEGGYDLIGMPGMEGEDAGAQSTWAQHRQDAGKEAPWPGSPTILVPPLT